MNQPRVSIIVAMDEKRGIGKTDLGAGKLLWHISGDMKRFKELTMGHALIMGRKTFESVLSYLKKPFPGRTSIVVTHDKDYKYEGAVVVHSFKDALNKAKKIEKDSAFAKASADKEIFVIGGGQIYEQALPFADRLYVTLVDGEHDADTFFPDYSDFKKVVSQEKGESNGLRYTWLTLER